MERADRLQVVTKMTTFGALNGPLTANFGQALVARRHHPGEQAAVKETKR
jgi:hypothetical protein